MSILASPIHHIGQWIVEPSLAGVLANLRAPPFLPAAIFEMHLTWWVVAAAIGGVLIVLARRQADLKLLRAGQGVLVVTLLWILAAQTLDTAGERLHKVHHTLAAATEKADVETIVGYFDTSFSGVDLGVQSMTREDAREVLTEVFKTIAPKEIKIWGYEVQFLPDGTAAVTRITVIARVMDLGPSQTRWEISWADSPGADWRIVSVRPLERMTADGPRP